MSFHNNLHMSPPSPVTPDSYLEEETEADPLVVSDVSPLFRVDSLVNPWMGHIDTNPLPECAGYRVGGVDPAVRVQHVLGNVFGVDTVYGVANILSGRHYQGECEEEGHCGSVVEAEYAGVDGDVVRLHQTFQSSEYFQHCPQQTLILVSLTQCPLTVLCPMLWPG